MNATFHDGIKGDMGPQGPQGQKGETGATGALGEAGPKGDPGVGVPVGGIAGQILSKKSGSDYDTEWKDCEEQTQADWNQNDPTKDDYIKNRPMYQEYSEIFNETITTRKSRYGFQNHIALVDGSTYIITFNGITYSCVCSSNSIGNEHILGSSATNTGEPFIILSDDSYTDLFVEIDGTYSVSIEGPSFVQIPEQYLKNYSKTIVIQDDKIYMGKLDDVYSTTLNGGEFIWSPLSIGSFSGRINSLSVQEGSRKGIYYHYVDIIYKDWPNMIVHYAGQLDSTTGSYYITSDSYSCVSKKATLYKNMVEPYRAPAGGATETFFTVNNRSKDTLTVDWLGNITCSSIILHSSTPSSIKEFKITVDDGGIITAMEVAS